MNPIFATANLNVATIWKEEKMKKNMFYILISILLMIAISVTSCSKETETEPTSGAAVGNSQAAADVGSVKRIAVILDPVGVNPFLTQVVDKIAEIREAGTYPMEYTIVECTDSAAWAENVRASVEEGYNLILAVGWQGADPISQVAAMFPDKADYAIINYQIGRASCRERV